MSWFARLCAWWRAPAYRYGAVAVPLGSGPLPRQGWKAWREPVEEIGAYVGKSRTPKPNGDSVAGMGRWIEHVFKCEQCLELVRVREVNATAGERVEPPEPWREISVWGWAGRFVVCSDACADALRARYLRPEGAPELPPEHSEREATVSLGTLREALVYCEMALRAIGISPAERLKLEAAAEELRAAIRKARG